MHFLIYETGLLADCKSGGDLAKCFELLTLLGQLHQLNWTRDINRSRQIQSRVKFDGSRTIHDNVEILNKIIFILLANAQIFLRQIKREQFDLVPQQFSLSFQAQLHLKDIKDDGVFDLTFIPVVLISRLTTGLRLNTDVNLFNLWESSQNLFEHNFAYESCATGQQDRLALII